MIDGAKHKAKEEEKQAKKESKVAATPAPSAPAKVSKDKKKKSNPICPNPNLDADPALEGIKKPQTAYIIYSTHRRNILSKEHPELPMVELSKLMGAEWTKMTDEQKKPWNKKAVEAKAEYELKVEAARNRDRPAASIIKPAATAPKTTPAPSKVVKVIRKDSSDLSSINSDSSDDEKKVIKKKPAETKKPAVPISDDSSDLD